MANAIADAYIEWNIESRFRQVARSAQFLATQIEQAKKEIAVKERELLSYTRQKSADGSADSSDSQQKLETLNRDYASAVGDRVSKEAKDYEARTASPESLANTVSSGLVAQLQSEVARLERDYAEKLNLYKPEWPAMEQLKSQSRRPPAPQPRRSTTPSPRRASGPLGLPDRAAARVESLAGIMRSQKSEALTLNTNAVRVQQPADRSSRRSGRCSTAC